MSGIDAQTSETEDFVVISSYDQEQVDSIAQALQEVAPKLKSVVNADRNKAMVKGKMTLFVFERRYDLPTFFFPPAKHKPSHQMPVPFSCSEFCSCYSCSLDTNGHSL